MVDNPGALAVRPHILRDMLMKKTLVAVGVIVALGVVWTGAAWYTGKQFENRLADSLATANAQLQRNSPDAGLELAYQHYQRHIFSSQLQLIVRAAPGAQNGWLAPGKTVILDEDVDHGPFPLAQLKKFNLIPSLASVRTTLVNNDVSKPLFEMAKGGTPLLVNTRVSYGGATASDIKLSALNYDKQPTKIVFSGGQFNADIDDKGDAISVSGDVSSALVASVNQYGQHIQMTFNNLKTDGATEISAFSERIGKQKMTLEKLAIAIEGKQMAVLDGLTLDAKTEQADDKKHLNSALDFTLDSLKVQDKDMGSGKLMAKIGQLNGEAWHQFSQNYNREVNALLTQPEVMNNEDLYQEKFRQIVLKNFPLMLKGNPVFTLAPLSWKNAKGEGSLNLSLTLQDGRSLQPSSPAEAALRNVKNLDGKLQIPLDVATELMTQIAMLEGYEQEQAGKLARQQVQGLAAMGQMFRLTTVKDDAITSSLQYGNGQITLNGDRMAVDELFGKFALPGLNAPEPDLNAPEARPAPEPYAVPVTP